ncbi:hypothetical protein Tco_1269243 [Tanacetum coccineum]
MAVLDSCPKHNMVAYLEKSEGNAEFHEIIDFLTRSSIHHALTAIFDAIQLMGYEGDLTVLTFNKALFSPQWRHLDAKKKFVMYPRFISIFLDKKLANVPVPLDHFPVNTLTGKVFSFMVKKGKHFSGKVTPLFASMLIQPTKDEGAPSERPSEAQPTPSPAHTSEVPIEQQTDPSPRPSPSTIILDYILECYGGNLGGHSSSDKSLSGNEGEMTLQSVYDLYLSLCAQVSDQAKEIQHLKAQIKKLKKQAKPLVKHHRAWMKSGRKFAKGKPSVHKDPLFDEIHEDTLDYIETEDVQDVWRTRDVVDEEKENDEDLLSTEDVLSTDQQKVNTDMEKVSTDRPIVSTDGSKVSTNRQKDRFEPKDKGKKKIEEADESESESDGIPEAEKKFKQLKKYPLRKKVLLQMLELKLESEEDSTMALELIRFVKKLLAELEPEDSNGDEEDL